MPHPEIPERVSFSSFGPAPAGPKLNLEAPVVVKVKVEQVFWAVVLGNLVSWIIGGIIFILARAIFNA